MRREYPFERVVVAAARGKAAFFWCAKCFEVNIGDAALVEACRELVLGKTRSARRGDRAYVDQELYAGAFEFVQHGLLRRLLIADGEKRLRLGDRLLHSGDHFTRSISSIAPAGARTLPSWIT